ncbi:MAG: alpha/beta hydrolase [Chloroflexota bacterium]|nr:alpha/beta hydrolase [Chloroflexota bacterium]
MPRAWYTSALATFCLLHGNWHDGSCWQPLVESLQARGHQAVAPDLPFDDPGTGYADRIRPALEALENVSGTVVVVGHSIASAYAPLVAAELAGSLLVHLCPRMEFTPPPGAPDVFRKGFPFPARRPDGASVWEPEAAVDAMYPRLPPETGRALAERLRPGAPPADGYPLPGHPDVPTVLIYTPDDEFFEPEWERFMARELLGIEPIELPGGHFPMVEDPEGLADLLNRLARGHEASAPT